MSAFAYEFTQLDKEANTSQNPALETKTEGDSSSQTKSVEATEKINTLSTNKLKTLVNTIFSGSENITNFVEKDLFKDISKNFQNINLSSLNAQERSELKQLIDSTARDLTNNKIDPEVNKMSNNINNAKDFDEEMKITIKSTRYSEAAISILEQAQEIIKTLSE